MLFFCPFYCHVIIDAHVLIADESKSKQRRNDHLHTNGYQIIDGTAQKNVVILFLVNLAPFIAHLLLFKVFCLREDVLLP